MNKIIKEAYMMIAPEAHNMKKAKMNPAKIIQMIAEDKKTVNEYIKSGNIKEAKQKGYKFLNLNV